MKTPVSGDGSTRWRTARAVLRRHAAFVALLAAGLALRVGVMIGYPHAFFYMDSFQYHVSSHGWRPDPVRQSGYPLFLKVMRRTEVLWSVTLVQHLLGMLIAVVIYLLLVRRSVPRWLAVVATAPVLLDAFQLTVEHYVLAETIFTALTVAGLLVLLWPPRLSVAAGGVAGLLLALSATFRTVSLPLVIVTGGYLLVRRAGWRPTVAYLGCALVILGGYQLWFYAVYHQVGYSTMQGAFLYGRVAPTVDCARLELTQAEQVLCPRLPVGQRPVRSDWYIYSPERPSLNVDDAVQRSFARKAYLGQPSTMATVIAADVGLYLLPAEVQPEWICVTNAMLLPAEPPAGPSFDWCRPNPRRTFAGKPDPASAPPATALTRALGAYARHAQTPNLVLGLSLLLVLVAMVWRPRRRSGAPVADLLLITGWGLGLLVLAVAGSMFDERYGLPALPLLPAAGALAAHRLWLRRRAAVVDAGAHPGRVEVGAAVAQRSGGSGAGGSVPRQASPPAQESAGVIADQPAARPAGAPRERAGRDQVPDG